MKRVSDFMSRRMRGEIFGVVLPDMHVPDHDAEKISLICDMMRRHRVSFCVQLGDFLDMHGLGRWATPGDSEGQRLVAEAAVANQVLDQIVDAARYKNSRAQVVILEGNHEKRVQALFDQTPYLKGAFSVQELLHLRDRDVDWVPAWSQNKILRYDWTGRGVFGRVLSSTDWHEGDGVALIHGWYHNMHCAKKTAESYGRAHPILFGHTHTVQVYSPTTYGWPKPYAASIGHLRKTDVSYITGANRWQSAFAVIRMNSNNPGVTGIEIVQIQEDRAGGSHFWFGDKHYSTAAKH